MSGDDARFGGIIIGGLSVLLILVGGPATIALVWLSTAALLGVCGYGIDHASTSDPFPEQEQS